MNQKNKRGGIDDPKVAARALEQLFALGYVKRRTLYWENFVRGLFFSAGGVIGATILIAIIAWVLSLFDNLPLIGRLFENAQQTLQQTK